MNKRHLFFKSILPLLCLLTGNLFGQDGTVVTPSAYSSGSNVGGSIRTWRSVKPETNPNNITTGSSVRDFRLTTEYIDGLSRPVQMVIKQGSLVTGGTAYDMASTKVYDDQGRETRTYLPFADTASSGNFQVNPFQQQSSFYSGGGSPIAGQGENYYYGKTEYEATPFGRVQKSFAPGDSWVHGGKGKEMHYWNNTSIDSVRIWSVTDNSGSFGSYSSTRLYAAGALYKFITIDEQSNQVVEFKDKEGKTILKKIQLTAQADTGTGKGYYGWLCTYYIYDVVGRLRVVVQPAGVEQLVQHSWDLTWNSSVLLNEQCFRYEYDAQGRLIMKKVPGAAMEEMVYDARDRLVLTRDGNLTTAGKWLYILYDALNRPVSGGLWTNSSSRATHQSSADSSTSYPNLSGQTYELLSETHYDDYGSLPSGLSSSLTTTWITSTYFITSGYNSSPDYAQAIAQGTRITGMVAWTRVKVLGTSSQFLSTAFIYDDKGRKIQSQNINLTTGLDVSTVQFDFEGKPLRSHVRHQAVLSSATKNYEIGTKNTYDSLGRVTKAETQINSGGWKVVSEIAYDAFGRVAIKKFGTDPTNSSNPLETMTYAYNIRGWLLGANRDYAKDGSSTANYFGFDLGYDKSTIQATGQSSIGGYSKPFYNGNIGGTVWKSKGDGVIRKYDFDYDNASRLTNAIFNQNTSGSTWESSTLDFSMHGPDADNAYGIKYDANGNILKSVTHGWKPGNGDSYIDDLVYTYMPYSNKLQQVEDLVNDKNSRLGDFKYDSATKTSTDYTYDDNGNMVKDLNKNIVTYSGSNGIVYNYLNLPQTITVKKDGSSNRGTIDYTYDATGNKLKKVVTDSSTVTTTLYMIGTYVNDTLQFIAHEDGRIRYRADSNDYVYDYFLKDHLGNVRMVLTEEQQLDQYPAVTFEGSNTANEQVYYEKADIGRTARPGAFNSSTTNGDTVQLLNKSTQSVGAGKLLKVMAGDRIHVKVDYYIPSATTDNGSADGITALLSQLASILNAGNAPAVLKGNGTILTSGLGSDYPFTSFMSPQTGSGGSLPKAYLNIVFFDEQFNFVSQNSESVQVTTEGSGQQLTRIGSSAKEAPKNGYVYIYVSNESNNLVYFDNLQVSHERGRILEENHYYPFGLKMAGICSKASGKMETRFRFNGGTEFNNDLDIASYETQFRGYDAQIGRFGQVDPMAGKYSDWSPYSFAFDNPIAFNDPLGADPGGPSLEDLINALLTSGYGGTITPDGNGGWVSSEFGNLDAAFFAGAQYASLFNMWGNYGTAPSFNDALNRFNGGGITNNMVAAYYSLTWGGQASNISVNYAWGGYNVNFTATSNGSSYTNMFVSAAEIKANFDQLMGLYSTQQQYVEGDESGWIIAGKTTETVGLTFETTDRGLIAAQKLANLGSGTTSEILRAGKVGTRVGAGLGALNIGLTVMDGLTNEKGWQNHHTADIAVSAGEIALAAFEVSSPIGWGFALFMFVGNMVSEHYTGKSMTENLFD